MALAQAYRSLQGIDMKALARHEAELTAHALLRMSEIDGVQVYGLADPNRTEERLGTIPFNLQGVDHAKGAAVLSF